MTKKHTYNSSLTSVNSVLYKLMVKTVPYNYNNRELEQGRG